MGKKNIIAVMNQKGGPGKTTTCIDLGSTIVQRGASVTVVDADPQSTLTAVACEPDSRGPFLGDLLLNQQPTDEDFAKDLVAAMRPSMFGFYVLRSDVLSGVKWETARNPTPGAPFKKIMDEVTSDVIIVDCPPSLSLSSLMVLHAADWLLVPVEASVLSMPSLALLVQTLVDVAEVNPDLKDLGLLVTKYDNRTNDQYESLVKLRQTYGGLVLNPPIPIRTVIPAAIKARKPLWEMGQKGREAQGFYERIANQIAVKTNLFPEREGISQ